jgi:protein SCO1/2
MRLPILMAGLILLTSCTGRSPTREYTLDGQVLAIRPADHEIVIRHGDVQGLMPGMTMPFRLSNDKVSDGVKPGDFVTATLVVSEGDSWITRVTPTGRHAPVPAGAELPHVMQPPLTPGEAVPQVSLTDQDGRPFRPADLRGHAWALTFVYTRCPLPNFCPALERRFGSAARAIAHDPALSGVRLVSVSIDPDHDTPPVLKAHAIALDADLGRWRFVTGRRADVDRFGERFGVTVVRGNGSPEEFVHSMRTAVIDREGRLVKMFEGADWSADALVAGLREAAAR